MHTQRMILKKQAVTRSKRRNHSIQIMKRFPQGLYNCKECIHFLTKSCSEPLLNSGCEHFYDAVNNRSFQDEQTKIKFSS